MIKDQNTQLQQITRVPLEERKTTITYDCVSDYARLTTSDTKVARKIIKIITEHPFNGYVVIDSKLSPSGKSVIEYTFQIPTASIKIVKPKKQ